MKCCLIAGFLLVSIQSLACNQLVGTWSCVSNENDEAYSYKLEYKIQNGTLVGTSVNEGESPEIVVFDGSEINKSIEVMPGFMSSEGKLKSIAVCGGNPVITNTTIEIPMPATLGLITDKEISGYIELTRRHTVNGKSLTIQVEINNFVIENGVKTRSEEGSASTVSNCTKT